MKKIQFAILLLCVAAVALLALAMVATAILAPLR